MLQSIFVNTVCIFFFFNSAANSCPTSPRGGHGGLAGIKRGVNAENLVQAAYAAMEDKGDIANTGQTFHSKLFMPIDLLSLSSIVLRYFRLATITLLSVRICSCEYELTNCVNYIVRWRRFIGILLIEENSALSEILIVKVYSVTAVRCEL